MRVITTLTKYCIFSSKYDRIIEFTRLDSLGNTEVKAIDIGPSLVWLVEKIT